MKVDLDEKDLERFPRNDGIPYTFLREGADLDFTALQRFKEKKAKPGSRESMIDER